MNFDQLVSQYLNEVTDASTAATCLNDEHSDWFSNGLDSLRVFELFDLLADSGIDIDYGEFVRTPTLAGLREQAASNA